MSKLLAAVLSCAFLSTGNIMGPTITLSPLPPTQGQIATINYSGGTNPQTLQIEWVPTGAGPASVTTDANGDVEITIPDTATSMNITGGGAPAEASIVKEG